MDSKKLKKEASRQANEDFRGIEQTCHLHSR